jgi:hypothetical protein
MARCGAKTRSGTPCQSQAMENGRCRMHGGTSTGAPIGNKNAAKHGIYSTALLPGEDECAGDLRNSIGAVEDELFITRLRLRRALKAEADAIQSNNFLVIDSEVQRDGDGKAYAAAETHLKRVDYTAIIDRLTARIESLEKTRAELQKNNPPGDEPVTRIEIEVVAPKEVKS